MGKRDDDIPSKAVPSQADPRRGANPGYAEDQPRSPRDARRDTPGKPAPNPDEPGLRRDPDPPADPARRPPAGRH